MDWRTPTAIAALTCSVVAVGIAFGSRQRRSQTVAPGPVTSEARRVESYRGYRIDVSFVQHQTNVAEVLQSVHQQLDIVEGVRLGSKVRSLVRAIPLVMIPGSAPNARYLGRFGIQIDAAVQSPDKPMLLHEYMHAYHAQALPGGTDNPDVLGFYRQALERKAYPRGSDAVGSVGEFFAITASTFLYGRVAGPPYTRDELCRAQPDYCVYLTNQLGEPSRNP
jgi:hypothetical protein